MTHISNLTETQVEEILKKHIAQEFMYDRPGLVLDNDFPLIEEGVIDSMGIFRLISFLEERFELTIDPDQVLLENFETVNSIKFLILESKS